MKFVTACLLASTAVVSADHYHDMLMEELAKQEKLHPSGKGFVFPKKEDNDEEKDKHEHKLQKLSDSMKMVESLVAASGATESSPSFSSAATSPEQTI